MMQKDEIPIIAKSLTGNGFCFNSTRDTVLLHIRYTELLQKKGAITAIVDAYSSFGETHLALSAGTARQCTENAKQDVDFERILRDDPELFFIIHDTFGVSQYTDGAADKSMRIVIEDDEIVSSTAYHYSFFVDEHKERSVNQLINERKKEKSCQTSLRQGAV